VLANEQYDGDRLPIDFGNKEQNLGGTWNAPYIWGIKATCPSDGTGLSISVKLDAYSPTTRLKCALYRASDNQLVGVTEELTGLPHNFAWHTFNFLNPKPTLTANTDYLIVAWSDADNTNRVSMATLTGVNGLYFWNHDYGDFPQRFDGAGPFQDLPTIYCTLQATTEYTIAITATQGGTTDPPPGINYFVGGTIAVITANPYYGYDFDHWVLDGVVHTENPINIFMDGNHTLDAVFVVTPPPPQFNLTITSTAGGTTDPAPGTYPYSSGATAVVSAYPSSGYNFDHWLLDGAVFSGTPIYIVMDDNHSLQAMFTAIPPPVQHNLTITSTTGGTTYPVPGTYPFDEGLTVPVEATPAEGYQFIHWELDGVIYTTNPINILMNSDHTLHAVFEAIVPTIHRLTVQSTPLSVPVTLDGAPIGSTPIEANVTEGNHTVEVPGEVST
jgi:hypothetical protein